MLIVNIKPLTALVVVNLSRVVAMVKEVGGVRNREVLKNKEDDKIQREMKDGF